MTRVPAYHQVATALRERISAGGLRPGERLPSEAELVEHFGVSRNTVRQALDVLHSVNLISRQQGRGTFVASHGLSHVIGELKSLTDVLIERGFQPGIRDLTIVRDHNAPVDATEFLRTPNLWRVERLRTVDDQPFCIMISWLTDDVGSRLNPRPMAKEGSLYRCLGDQFGIHLKEATEIIRAEAATRNEATRLEIAPAAPLIVTYRWAEDQNGRPVEYVRAATPGDRYQYVAKLRA